MRIKEAAICFCLKYNETSWEVLCKKKCQRVDKFLELIIMRTVVNSDSVLVEKFYKQV